MKKLALIALLVATPALGHGWYDSACCNDKDCEPIPAYVELHEVKDGWLVNGTLVPRDKVKQSKDDNFHWCHYPGSIGAPIIRCLYIPLGF